MVETGVVILGRCKYIGRHGGNGWHPTRELHDTSITEMPSVNDMIILIYVHHTL